MFIDKVKIYVKSGNGGNGCVSFRREKYVSHGGPDGGDGGKGGSIVFVIDEGENTLMKFKYRRKFIAANGEDGRAAKFHGKNAEDLLIPVPRGTVIKDAESGRIIKDMSDSDVDENGGYVLLAGGKGGFGNTHFATPTRQAPNFAKSGIKGRELEVELELKMLADAGLVGMPSAGKSTILSVLSSAKPKIADYHFTTLAPMLGVVSAKGGNFVLADLPGLIEGASEGLGLGHEFLRHIDRCRLLVHVVDASGCEGRDPIEDVEKISEELVRYSPELAERPRILVGNKLDMTEEATKERLAEYAKAHGWDIIFICAAIAEGTDELSEMIAEKLAELPPLRVYESEVIPDEELFGDEGSEEITVTRENDTFYVEAPRIINVINSINFTDRESVAYFQKILRKSGVIDALEEKGIQEGQTVSIYGAEFEYYR